MLFNYEYEKKLRVGYIGAGEHSFRNILPSLQYAPVELVALADHHPERGLAIARQFGARRFYPNHQALLNKEKGQLDAVIIVIGRDATGRPRYPEVAGEALRAGFHTWIEEPPCFSVDEVMSFTSACMTCHKYIATGFKKMFMPTYLKVAQIIEDPSFGGVSSFSLRYPLIMPAADKRSDPLEMSSFLDFVRPYSLLVRLFGESQGFSFHPQRRLGRRRVQFPFPQGCGGLATPGRRPGGDQPLGTARSRGKRRQRGGGEWHAPNLLSSRRRPRRGRVSGVSTRSSVRMRAPRSSGSPNSRSASCTTSRYSCRAMWAACVTGPSNSWRASPPAMATWCTCCTSWVCSTRSKKAKRTPGSASPSPG